MKKKPVGMSHQLASGSIRKSQSC